MAFGGYKGQSIGRMMHYLYDGYGIPHSDQWTFVGGTKGGRGPEIHYGHELVAHIIPQASEDDPPLFDFTGPYSHWNDVQKRKRTEVRKEELAAETFGTGGRLIRPTSEEHR